MGVSLKLLEQERLEGPPELGFPSPLGPDEFRESRVSTGRQREDDQGKNGVSLHGVLLVAGRPGARGGTSSRFVSGVCGACVDS